MIKPLTYLFIIASLWLVNAYALPLKIKVTGIEKDLQNNVENALTIMKLQDQEAPDELRLDWLYQQGKEEILTALQPFGYFKPTINSQIANTDKHIEINYSININDKIKVSNAQISLVGAGKDEKLFHNILAKNPIKNGEDLDQKKYDQLKSQLQDGATTLGYFDVEFTKREILVDLDKYTANIHLEFSTGSRYKFGKVNFKSQIIGQPLLNRYLKFHEGDLYSDDQLSNLQGNLIASDYFDSVDINAPPDSNSKIVPIDINLEARKKTQYSIGVGYGTDQGARLRGDYEWRYLNAQGHKINIETLIAQKKQNILFEYLIPGKNPVTDWWRGYIGFAGEQNDSINYITALIGLSHTQATDKLTTTYALDYRIDSYKEFVNDKEQKFNTKLLIPSVNWNWKSQKTLRFDESGLSFDLLIRGAVANLLSDISFLQSRLKTKFILPFNDKNRLILRADAGTTLLEGNQIAKLPPNLRFYAGGDTSVRGYALDAIAPRNTKGHVVGGKSLLVASIEYEHKIKESYGLAVFMDAGDAFNDIKWSPKFGAGIGGRWHSPIGVVRLDLARGFDQTIASAFRVHVTIGVDL